jgi:hypothetical protein
MIREDVEQPKCYPHSRNVVSLRVFRISYFIQHLRLYFFSVALTVHPSLPSFLIAYPPSFLIAISSSLFFASNLEAYASRFPYSILCSQAVNYCRNVKLFPLGTTNTYRSCNWQRVCIFCEEFNIM